MSAGYIVFTGLIIIVIVLTLVITGLEIYIDGMNKVKSEYCKSLGDCIIKDVAPRRDMDMRNEINFTDICYCK